MKVENKDDVVLFSLDFIMLRLPEVNNGHNHSHGISYLLSIIHGLLQAKKAVSHPGLSLFNMSSVTMSTSFLYK